MAEALAERATDAPFMLKPLVAVRWLDAHGSATSAYAEHEIPHAAIEITTYGLLLREDTAGVSVANEWCADGTYRGVTFVPKAMVLEVKPVIPLRKPKQKKATPLVVEVALPAPLQP